MYFVTKKDKIVSSKDIEKQNRVNALWYSVFQKDSNFVLYDSNDVGKWSSGTNGQQCGPIRIEKNHLIIPCRESYRVIKIK